MSTFFEIATQRIWAKHPERINRTVIALDPGETTGVAMMRGSQLTRNEQLPTKKMPEAAAIIANYLDQHKPSLVIMEDYKVYSWKTDMHAWQSLHTPRLIGAVEYMCLCKGIPLHKQMAQQAKQFCTDDKLKDWGFYLPGKQHARDATRHICYHLLFTEGQFQT